MAMKSMLSILLTMGFKQLYYDLLNEDIHFSGFFRSIEYVPSRRPLFLRKSLAGSMAELLEGNMNFPISDPIPGWLPVV